jgi:hypothetical protein
MFKRLILILSVFILSMTAQYCSNSNNQPTMTDAGCVQWGVASNPPDPLNDRPNPLGIHIRTNWTAGDPDKTGGLHYGHVKVAGLTWQDLGNYADGDDQAEFVVDHFDLYTWGGSVVGEHANGQYMDFIWLMPAVAIPYISSAWDSSETASWLNDPSLNTAGYTWDDLVMHWKYDGTGVFGPYSGWNPTDDTNDDGCRDSIFPSDTTRSAECITDAEIMWLEYKSGRPWWNFSKVMHDGYLKMRSDRIVELKDEMMNETSYEARGAFFDCGATNEGVDFGIQNSFTYENADLLTANRAYYLDKLLYTPTLAANYMEPLEPDMNIHLVNMVSPYYTCATSSPAKDWAFEYLENIFLECWIKTGCAGFTPMTMEGIPDYLNCPYLDWLNEDKGVVFCGREPEPGSDRGKLFTLCTFYLINHQMAFYCYFFEESGIHVSDWNWNPYVEYDVGQPVVNTLGYDDFQGNSGTNLYFELCNNPNFKILGREYEKDDGTHVLVLSKIMASGSAEGASPTTHALPRCYRKVQPDLSLGPALAKITLTDNDGAILVEESNCPPVADFTADTLEGCTPLTVYFTDLSDNFPTTWDWNFGNGDGSLLQNPHATYSQSGTYTVSLTVTNSDGSDTEVKAGYITVNEPGGGNKVKPGME